MFSRVRSPRARRTLRAPAFTLAACAFAGVAHAQQFTVLDREVQVHGSIQQGFVFSDANNFLTMDTSDGSAAMTDGAINVGARLTPKLRVGVQFYGRNIGELGNGRPQVDWAFADYRFSEYVGVRAGKVKTPLGLFNDTQDMEFLHTWALLPQGVYPLDLRSVTIAHVGGDVYGTLRTKKLGSLTYTGHYGVIPDDARGGYRYGMEDAGLALAGSVESRGGGIDLRWNTPVEGLLAGYSLLAGRGNVDTRIAAFGMLPLRIDIPSYNRQALFGDFQHGAVRFSGEFRREMTDLQFSLPLFPSAPQISRAWFVSGAYRLNERLELGSYFSNYVVNTALPSSADDNHITDRAVTARVDLNRFWSVKVEGHFMDGYGSPGNAHGFYPRSNPDGMEARTNMVVVRTGFTF